jgi:hypothetical protein
LKGGGEEVRSILGRWLAGPGSPRSTCKLRSTNAFFCFFPIRGEERKRKDQRAGKKKHKHGAHSTLSPLIIPADQKESDKWDQGLAQASS